MEHDGKVWWCPKCQATQPRWHKDLVQDLMKGGVLCICKTRMKLRDGKEVQDADVPAIR